MDANGSASASPPSLGEYPRDQTLEPMQIGTGAESAHASPRQHGSPVDAQLVHRVARLRSGASAMTLEGASQGDSSSDGRGPLGLLKPTQTTLGLLDGPARQCWDSFNVASEIEKTTLIRLMLGSIPQESLSAIAVQINLALKADFVTLLPVELTEKIFSYLSFADLFNCSLVSKAWNRATLSDTILRPLFRKQLAIDPSFQEFVDSRAPTDVLASRVQAAGLRPVYSSLRQAYRRLEENWRTGTCRQTTLQCGGNGVYCIQYDDKKLLSGSRDCKIRVWDLQSQQCLAIYSGHMGSVLCLQYDEDKIISGSSDSTARVWDLATGNCRTVLTNHTDSVLHLKFRGQRLVTCSKDFRVILWHQDAPFSYQVDKILTGHNAAVNVVDLTEEHIVSASGDRTIRVWSPLTGECQRIIQGHSRGIACLHLRGSTIVTGSSDETVRMWDIESGEQIRMMRGHQGLVRCIRFSDKYIVSGSYDNSIILWNAQTGERLCRLSGHESRVFRVQFDAFKIVSSSQDDTIRIWDFTPTD